MQQAENGGEEKATVDVQFTDLPNALIACKVPEDLFHEGSLRVRTKLSSSVLIPADVSILFSSVSFCLLHVCRTISDF